MRPLLLQFRLSDPSQLVDLLHELNLEDEVDARSTESSEGVVVLVALPDTARLLWSVRSTVSLFDPGAVELGEDHRA